MFVLINLLKKLRDFKKYFKLHLKHFYFCLNPFFDNQAYIQYFFVHASKVSSFKTKKKPQALCYISNYNIQSKSSNIISSYQFQFVTTLQWSLNGLL